MVNIYFINWIMVNKNYHFWFGHIDHLCMIELTLTSYAWLNLHWPFLLDWTSIDHLCLIELPFDQFCLFECPFDQFCMIELALISFSSLISNHLIDVLTYLWSFSYFPMSMFCLTSFHQSCSTSFPSILNNLLKSRLLGPDCVVT